MSQVDEWLKPDGALPPVLSGAYWIGGSPCSGKSSVAEGLAERYGLRYYSCDAAFTRHHRLVTPEKQPIFARVMALDQEQLWMRPVEQQVREEIAIYHEEFPMILADLLEFPSFPLVLVEGAALLPELVLPWLVDPRRYIAIVPSPAFQLEHYSRREWTKQWLDQCSDPVQAFRNWMERDIRFGQEVLRQADEHRLRSLVTDGARSISATLELAAEHFGLLDSEEVNP